MPEYPAEQMARARAMEKWAGVGRPGKPAKKRSWKGAMETAVAEAKDFQARSGWSWAEPKHLVGLYVVLHEHVYGVAPEELVDGWPGAVSAAAKLVRDEFNDQVHAAVAFLRWVWARERAREKTREPGQGSRIGWRWQFTGRALLVDYRVDLARVGRLGGGKTAGK